MMQHYTIALFIFAVVSVFFTCTPSSASVISCPPANGVEVSPNLRQLCYAIEQAISDVQASPSEYRLDERTLPEKKRQDVDHVFLRFGRRFGY